MASHSMRTMLAGFGLGCSVGDATGADAGLPPAAVGPGAGQPTSDPSRCLAGNICVQDRCTLACTRHVGCPGGRDCREVEGQHVCVENGLQFGSMMFGFGCGTNGDFGFDATKGFVCMGGKDAPDSYCTKSGCTSDAECPGDYYCEEIDWADGSVKAVYVQRGFCMPARGLVDCNDADAVYATDINGKGICSKQCTGAGPSDRGGGNGCFETPRGYQCWPRAKTCEPRKTFCSRCLSKIDCPADGICYYENFTKERFCTQTCSQSAPFPECEGNRQGYCYASESRVGGQSLPHLDNRVGPAACWTPCRESGCE